MNFYIADTHFGHANIIRYDDRPFSSAEEMDEAMISNWNAAVSDADTVYILGDVSWYGSERTREILGRLNGKKVLIRGNHDEVCDRLTDCFIKTCDYLELDDGSERVVLSHYPMPFWNGQFQDSVHLYGHVHDSHQWNMMESWKKEMRQLQAVPTRMLNVGCMMKYMGYTPRTLDELKDALTDPRK